MSGVVEVESCGLKFSVADPAHYPYGDNTFRDEEEVKAAFLAGIGPGDVLIDVGAAWGGYAMVALARGASVLAIDSTEDSERILVGNASLNGWEHRLEFRRAALWDGTDEYPEWMRREIFGVRYPTGGPPRIVSLDRMILELVTTWSVGRRIAAMKVDVEGAELGVLRGAQRLLRLNRPRVLVEDHAGIYPDVSEEASSAPCRELLRGLGYEVEDRWYGDRPGGRNFIWAR